MQIIIGVLAIIVGALMTFLQLQPGWLLLVLIGFLLVVMGSTEHLPSEDDVDTWRT